MDNPYAKIEREDNYHKWSRAIPYINFPGDWLVRIEPPFRGTMARFMVKKEGMEKSVSVLLDCHCRCDPHEQHYWEVYPLDCEYKENQCDISDVDKLLKMIEKSLIEISL